jgi:hypothetical protein
VIISHLFILGVIIQYPYNDAPLYTDMRKKLVIKSTLVAGVIVVVVSNIQQSVSAEVTLN